MGSAFTHQIWRTEESIRPCGNSGSLSGKLLVRIDTVYLSAQQAVTKPAQGKARRLGDTHHVPAAGNGVAKGMQASLWIEGRTIRRREHNTRCPDCDTYRSGPNNAHAGCPGCLVSRSRYDGRSSR